jgi:hypothetical protein
VGFLGLPVLICGFISCEFVGCGLESCGFEGCVMLRPIRQYKVG